jgi:hypothetical protein
MVADEQKKPLFMYREKRSRPQDSGWRIFSGFETQDYTDNPNNTGIYNPSTILKIDQSIEKLLLKGVGSVFERKDYKSEWYEVHDYKLEDDFIVEHKLTDKWSLKINNLFERIKEKNGDLLYTTGDKSLRIAVWNDNGKSQQQIYEEHLQLVNNRDQSKSKTIDIIDLSDGHIKRIGYEIKEKDDNKEYGVLYAFSIINEQLLQMAFYFDNQKDKEWAIKTWEQIKIE